MLIACASEAPVITEFERVEILVPVRTPISDELLRHPEPCTYPPTAALYIFDLDEMINCLEASLVFYFTELEKIREVNIGPDEVN